MSNSSLRLPFWVGILASTVALLAVAMFAGGGNETDTERIGRLQSSFACPTCDGQSVAESNAAVSVTIRQFIEDAVGAGITDDEIRDDLVRTYGVQVLLNPPAEGFAALVWLLPVLVLVAGSVGVATAVTRNATALRQPTEEDEELILDLRESQRSALESGQSDA